MKKPFRTRAARRVFGESDIAMMRVAFRRIGMLRLAKGLMNNPQKSELALALMFIRQFRLAYGSADLNHPAFRGLVQRACRRNDADFFKAIGRELSQKFPNLKDMASKLEKFLMDFWDGKVQRLGPKSPPLNVLNRESLAVVCNHFLKRPDDKHPFTEDAVEKTRQRLGLKPAKGKKLHVIEVGGRLKIVLRGQKSVRNPVQESLHS